MELKYLVEGKAFFEWFTDYLGELSQSRMFNPGSELRLANWQYSVPYFAQAVRLSGSPKPILITDLRARDFPQERSYSVSVLHGYLPAWAMYGQTPKLTGELFLLKIVPSGELVEATFSVENDGLESLFSEITEAMEYAFPNYLVKGREEVRVDGTPAQVVSCALNVVPAAHIWAGEYGPQDNPIRFLLGNPFRPSITFIDEEWPSNTREITALSLPGDPPRTMLVIDPNGEGGEWEKVKPFWENLLQELKRLGFVLQAQAESPEAGPNFPVSGEQTPEGDELPIPEGKTRYSPGDWDKIFRETSGPGRRPDYADIAQRTGKSWRYVQKRFNEWVTAKGDEITP